jgi:hypothetical protein
VHLGWLAHTGLVTFAHFDAQVDAYGTSAIGGMTKFEEPPFHAAALCSEVADGTLWAGRPAQAPRSDPPRFCGHWPPGRNGAARTRRGGAGVNGRVCSRSQLGERAEPSRGSIAPPWRSSLTSARSSASSSERTRARSACRTSSGISSGPAKKSRTSSGQSSAATSSGRCSYSGVTPTTRLSPPSSFAAQSRLQQSPSRSS